MKRRSFCEWMPMLPWPIWPLAGHARLGQNTVVGSMTILLSWLCWGAYQEEVCLDPRFLCNLTLPRLSVELPDHRLYRVEPWVKAHQRTLSRCLVRQVKPRDLTDDRLATTLDYLCVADR